MQTEQGHLSLRLGIVQSQAECTMATPWSVQALPVVLLLATHLTPVLLLRILVSYTDLASTMHQGAIATLVASTAINSVNLSALVLLLGYGDNGLRTAWQEFGSHLSGEMLGCTMTWARGNPAWQLILFDYLHVHNLWRFRDKHGLKESDFDNMLHLFSLHPSYSAAPDKLQKYEEIEPRGLWWPSFVATLAWKTILRDHTRRHWAGPVFRMGMLDTLDSFPDTKLVEIYTGTLGVAGVDTLKAVSSIHALIGVYLFSPNSILRHGIASTLNTYQHTLKDRPCFRVHRQIIVLWLWSWGNDGECDPPDGPFAILDAILNRPGKTIDTEQRISLNVLVLLVGGGRFFSNVERRRLIERIASLLPHMSDFDLSEFLWHAYLIDDHEQARPVVEELLSDQVLRDRLLRIEPFRRTRWISLLLCTSRGIAYFRRWMARYGDSHESRRLVEARDDAELLQAVRKLHWTRTIPLTALDGLPVARKLKDLLQWRLSETSSPFRTVSFGRPNRAWISQCGLPDSRAELDRYAEVVELVLRLRLHHEDPHDGPEETDTEIIYDLCDDVREFMTSAFQGTPFSELVKISSIVYPSWSGENNRSRNCGPSSLSLATHPQ